MRRLEYDRADSRWPLYAACLLVVSCTFADADIARCCVGYTCGDGEHGKTGHFDMTHEMLRRFRLVETLTPEKMVRRVVILSAERL